MKFYWGCILFYFISQPRTRKRNMVQFLQTKNKALKSVLNQNLTEYKNVLNVINVLGILHWYQFFYARKEIGF